MALYRRYTNCKELQGVKKPLDIINQWSMIETTYERSGRMEALRAKQVQDRAGVSRIQLMRYVEADAVRPVEDARGRGSVRTYSEQSVFEAAICKRLADVSIDLRNISLILRLIRDKGIYKQVAGLSKRDPNLNPYMVVTSVIGEDYPYQITFKKAKEIGKYFTYGTRKRRGQHKSELSIVIDLGAILSRIA
jgi:hypothetical protein